ncbi:L-ribulose-5-phosphate 4-epimerase [Acidisarcina polymorpha]|uniref:L-ribulose-5-phosphate 4-epimerase n=1 Tax=Acidisarcina polymorpha TaxID=2211140 RepID=A0A2Z5FYX8_9BACT|nr:L-ribulose-5-phosphate 4-epimerase [Acidisarcina polymorpha]AXC11734.1 L-ribulose-5-phosphate 4-epimerase [Acidisarcina polymorpha]
MLLPTLREEVLDANLELVRKGLVLYTFGNASGIDREQGLVAIKPSGVAYERLTAEDLVVVDLDGKIVEGTLNPSSDVKTHLLLYREFPMIGGVVHTHSEFATGWAQAATAIPCFGTTHADYFYGEVPVTRPLSDEEIEADYEYNTGVVIGERFKTLDPLAVPGVLVANHAPFAWGKTASAAAYNAVVLEYVAKLAFRTVVIDSEAAKVSSRLLRKHYERKHGPKATYGQRDS